MKKCRECKHYRHWDCHCPLPLVAEDDYHPLLQVNPTNPDRDASGCACYSERDMGCSGGMVGKGGWDVEP